jgi:hypothetical protein
MSKHLRDEARRTLELLDTLDRDLRDPDILFRLPPTLLAMVITQGVHAGISDRHRRAPGAPPGGEQ